MTMGLPSCALGWMSVQTLTGGSRRPDLHPLLGSYWLRPGVARALVARVCRSPAGKRVDRMPYSTTKATKFKHYPDIFACYFEGWQAAG
jgi:hypothetical protein